MSYFYHTEKIEDGIYRINSPENVFSELIVGEEKALLLDTGYGIGDLNCTVREITDLPLLIVNSHGHLDHACGNFRFQEPVYIHEKDMELCRQSNGVDTRSEAVDTAKHTMQYDTGEVQNILPAGFDEESYIHQEQGILIPVKEGDVFDLGGITLEVTELPGHTKGSIGLYSREKKILYVGDAINQFLWLFAPEAENLSTYIGTLRKAQTIDFERMFMGHNPVAGTKESLECYLDCALHLNYEKGFPFASPFPSIQADDIRICTREGYSPDDMMKPGFAAIVTSRGHCC